MLVGGFEAENIVAIYQMRGLFFHMCSGQVCECVLCVCVHVSRFELILNFDFSITKLKWKSLYISFLIGNYRISTNWYAVEMVAFAFYVFDNKRSTNWYLF